MQETEEMQVQFLGQKDPLEKEMALQYSCLENPMDRGAWRAAVHGVKKRLGRHLESQTRLSDFHLLTTQSPWNPGPASSSAHSLSPLAPIYFPRF